MKHCSIITKTLVHEVGIFKTQLLENHLSFCNFRKFQKRIINMKSLPIVVLIVVVLFEAHNLLVPVQAKEKSCRSVVQDLTKMQLGGISTCTKKMKFKNGKDKSKKMNCILRCVMMDVGILEKDGQVIEGERVGEFIRSFFPESLVDQANRTFFPCLNIGITNKFKTLEEDEFCTTYDPFVKCLLGNLPNLCPT